MCRLERTDIENRMARAKSEVARSRNEAEMKRVNVELSRGMLSTTVVGVDRRQNKTWRSVEDNFCVKQSLSSAPHNPQISPRSSARPARSLARFPCQCADTDHFR